MRLAGRFATWNNLHMTNFRAFADEIISTDRAAELLGIHPSQVKQLVKDNYLVAVKTGEGSGIPRKMLQSLDEAKAVAVVKPVNEDKPKPPPATMGPLWNLRGTITLLRDGGFSDVEILDWLWTVDEALDMAPIDALRVGLHHRVNNLAASLGF